MYDNRIKCLTVYIVNILQKAYNCIIEKGGEKVMEELKRLLILAGKKVENERVIESVGKENYDRWVEIAKAMYEGND